MASLSSDEQVGAPVLRAGWLGITFVHWRFPPADVQALLPAGLTVDEYDGSAWVSLTPFVLSDVRPPVGPKVPGMSAVRETNLRTYVRGPGGRDGLWFFSLETSSLALTLGARMLPAAPYHWGNLGVERTGDTFSYYGRRYGGSEAYKVVVRSGAPIAPEERDVWLTGRWRAYTRQLGGLLLVTPVQHEPWPLRSATIEVLEQNLLEAAGLPEPTEEPLVHSSPGVHDARMGFARLAS